MKTINELCGIVRESAYAFHVYHGHGHLKKVYENGLAHRLRKIDFDARQQHPILVLSEDGTVIGDFAAEILLEERFIFDSKAVKPTSDEHIAQLLGYLKSARIEHGLLINFGS